MPVFQDMLYIIENHEGFVDIIISAKKFFLFLIFWFLHYL